MASIPPNQTLYIRNLNDKIHKDTLKHTLYGLCVAYGRVLDIVALKTIKMRGQAFVVFDDITAAAAALRQLNGRQILGRPMHIEYALSKSNAAALNNGTLSGAKPHTHMSAAERKRLLGIIAPQDGAEKRRPADGERAEDGEPAAKRRNTQNSNNNSNTGEEGPGEDGPSPSSSSSPPSSSEDDDDDDDDDGVGPAAPSQNSTARDAATERPSNTLFVTNLPGSISDEQLVALFQQYAGFGGVRRIPGRSDMAFVDYAGADSAAAARSVLDGFRLSASHAMSVAFAQ
ncbi:hypothetical protein H4R18_005665 [Coemansia javaensis]|uniref:RRM domain-containing protein n=1 Tax=Coemansia javaensis TaxID=2761396 RepID=A0A9W8H7V2_9FUNG|nr:hypothetical protein H4R18_005665 [Coemansia javaensis]